MQHMSKTKLSPTEDHNILFKSDWMTVKLFYHKNNFKRTRGSFCLKFINKLRTTLASAAKNKLRKNETEKKQILC